MSLLVQSEDEHIASQYFDAINDLVGFVVLSLGYTALQFEQPIPFAAIAFVLAFIYAFSKGKQYRKIVDYYLPKGTHLIVYLQIVWQIKIFLLGMTFLFSIALGFTTKCGIYRLFGYACT